MQRSTFHNSTKPDEAVLQHLADSLIAAVRDRFRDSTQPGIRAGLRVTVNPLDATRIDISPGWGYTPNGERCWLKSSLLSISLTERSDQGIPTENWRIPTLGNGSYVDGTLNFVLLHYVEHDEHPLPRRDDPQISEYAIQTSRFEIEILTEQDYRALVGNDEWDASAVQDLGGGGFGLPAVPPFASNQFRVVIASVRARGPGQPILPSDVVSSDPGIAQPTDLTGARIISVSPNTPTGTGMLRWFAGSRTISWQAPSDAGPGPVGTIGDDVVTLRLESGSSVSGSLSIEVEIVPDSLPAIDIEEPIALVPRLEQSFPQPTQPRTVGGVVAKWVSTNTRLGDGALTFIAADQSLAWQAPGDVAAGPPVLIGAGGEFTVRSTTSAYVMRVFVSETGLPSVDTVEAIRVSGLYEQTFPIHTAVDLLHRSMVGSGIPTPRNPHGPTWSDIAESSGENIFEIHQDRFHVNGISIDADPAFLSCSVNEDAIDIATLDGDPKNRFLVAGQSYTQPRNVPSIQFSPAGVPELSGYYLVYIDPDGIARKARICEQLSFVDMAIGEDLPAEPPIRIMDVRRTTTTGNYGRIRYNADDCTFQYRGPGHATIGDRVAAASDITVTDADGDWIRLAIHMERLVNTVPTVRRDFQFFSDASVVNDQVVMPLAMVLWDHTNERFAHVQDLRRFATADVAQRFSRLLHEIDLAQGGAANLAEAMVREHHESHDNGISTRYAHGSFLDEDNTAYLVAQSGTSGSIQVLQPSSSYTRLRIRGRRHQYIAGKLDLIAGIPMVPVDEEPPNPGPLTWDFASEQADNGDVPESVACVIQVYVDEFARLGVHVRLRHTQDTSTKPIPAFAISDVSDSFPVGTHSLRCRVGVPSSAMTSLSIGIAGVWGPEVPIERDGRTTRLYSADGGSWVDVTNHFPIAQPLGDAQEDFEVLYPIPGDDRIELARVCYDGSDEVLRVVDTRPFGSIGERSNQVRRDDIQAMTHADGVVSGVEISWQDDTVNWTAGSAIVDGRLLPVAQGSYQNTNVGSSGLRRLFFSIEQDAGITISAGHQLVHSKRVHAEFAIAYIEDGGTNIEFVEDRRITPSPAPRSDASRRLISTSGVNGQLIRTGVAPASPFSSNDPSDLVGFDPLNYSSFHGFNVNMTADQRQGIQFWLDDEEKDGLLWMAIQKLDPATLPGSPYASTIPKQSQFAWFRVPAGPNPRSAAAIEFIGMNAFPIQVTKGGLTVFPAVSIELGEKMSLSSPGPGRAAINAIVSGGGGGGGGTTNEVHLFGEYLSGISDVLTGSDIRRYDLVNFGSFGKSGFAWWVMFVQIVVEGSTSPKARAFFNDQDLGVHESYSPGTGKWWHQVSLVGGADAINTSGNNIVQMQIEANGSKVSIDGRFMVVGLADLTP